MRYVLVTIFMKDHFYPKELNLCSDVAEIFIKKLSYLIKFYNLVNTWNSEEKNALQGLRLCIKYSRQFQLL